MKVRWKRFAGALLAAICFGGGAAGGAGPGEALEVGRFSAAALGDAAPPGWEPLTFRSISRHTRYAVVEEDGKRAVKAVAQASASGLVRRMSVDLRDYPMLRWRWKAANLVERGDVGRKAGDDYAVRIYVTFVYEPERAGVLDTLKYEAARIAYGEYPPYAGLTYIWDLTAPAGTVVSNAYTDRSRMIVVESGPARLGRWLTYERNVLQDYRAAFGEDPPRVEGVAIMTDTDNTGESVTAWYGDIEFLRSTP